MASDNKTVAEALELTRAIFFKDIGAVNEQCQWCRDKLSSQLDSIEAAYRREITELKNELNEWRSNCNFNHSDRKKKLRQIKELRECLRVALAGEYGRCRSRWQCALCSKNCNVKRWRKALEGASHT